MTIDWKRVAKPQPDQYDSQVIASLLYGKYGWTKHPQTIGPSFCDGWVAIKNDPTCDDAPVEGSVHMHNGMEYMTPERIADINHFLSAWPDAYEMLKHFLDEYWAKWSPIMTSDGRGSSSGHYDMSASQHIGSSTEGMVLNAVYVAANDPQGCMEGMYHEVAHARLVALGIGIDSHDGRLLRNTSDELYDSPIRWDIKRPMSAVFHAVYAWTMFSEVDIRAGYYEGMDIKNPRITPKHASASYLQGNIPKIEDGLREIRNYAKLTPEGQAFMEGFLEWGDTVVDRGKTLLKEIHGDRFDQVYADSQRYYREARLKMLADTAAAKAAQEGDHSQKIS